jgi:hypothetical protein
MYSSLHYLRNKEVFMNKGCITFWCITQIMSLVGMDKPPQGTPLVQKTQDQEISTDLRDKFNEEEKRLKGYGLDQPERYFFEKLHSTLGKNNSIEQYFDNLHIFANLLLAQHYFLSEFFNHFYINNYGQELRDRSEEIHVKLRARKTGENRYRLTAPSVAVLNELAAHRSLLDQKEKLTPEQLKVAIKWGFSQDPWLRLLSESILITDLGHSLAPEIQKINDQTSKTKNYTLDTFAPISKTYNKLPSIIKVNTAGLNNVKNVMIAKNNDEKISVVSDTAYLYSYTHAWYEQLYKIVRAEISNTIRELLTQKKDIRAFTKYSSNLFPDLYPNKILPSELPTIPKPHLYTQDQFDELKAQVKKELEEEKIKQEIERKQNTKIKQTADGSSYILEFEDIPTSITIHNQKNNTQEIIFKHESPFEIDKSGKNIFPIKYTDWVNQWFVDPKQAIATQGYNNPASLKFRAGEPEWKPIVLHAFSPLVDDYIKQWGRITTTKNRRNPAQEDILITIPGKMIYPSGTEEAGIFAYIIDSQNGQWYHRMFTPGSLSELTRNLFEKGYFAPQMTGYYDVFFPALAPRKK